MAGGGVRGSEGRWGQVGRQSEFRRSTRTPLGSPWPGQVYPFGHIGDRGFHLGQSWQGLTGALKASQPQAPSPTQNPKITQNLEFDFHSLSPCQGPGKSRPETWKRPPLSRGKGFPRDSEIISPWRRDCAHIMV